MFKRLTAAHAPDVGQSQGRSHVVFACYCALLGSTGDVVRGELTVTRKVRLLLFGGLVGLMLISGCQERSTPTKSVPATPKGVTVTVARDDLALSAWAPSETVGTSPIDLRLTLKNNSGRTRRWRDVHFGGSATSGEARIGRPLIEYNHSKSIPLVLRSGETTSVMYPFPLYHGTWTMRGFAFLDDEQLETPTITVVVQ
jgi:hypothetical protein